MAERAFWPTSQEQDFSQIEDLCRNRGEWPSGLRRYD